MKLTGNQLLATVGCILTLTGFYLILLVLPATAKVAVFSQQDFTQLEEITKAIQSLMQDVDITLHSLPSYEHAKVEACAVIERDLDAADERLGSILLLATGSAEMETWVDQVKMLNVLYYLLPKSKVYVTAKKNSIISVASASSDYTVASYGSRAVNILENQALPLLDRLYQRLVSLRK